ncbi:MAG: hypothetical protein JSW31_13605 [Burkholderiales bacterium]|nr:MAG: hypothetical protein JSW31_13605 [Burkholderiales bacterium]
MFLRLRSTDTPGGFPLPPTRHEPAARLPPGANIRAPGQAISKGCARFSFVSMSATPARPLVHTRSTCVRASARDDGPCALEAGPADLGEERRAQALSIRKVTRPVHEMQPRRARCSGPSIADAPAQSGRAAHSGQREWLDHQRRGERPRRREGRSGLSDAGPAQARGAGEKTQQITEGRGR